VKREQEIAAFHVLFLQTSVGRARMAKSKIDGVVQAVHYNPDGQVAWVRAYMRRGPTYSDRVMLDRQTLIAQLKSGKRYFIGEPIPHMASTFKVKEPLNVIEKNGQQFLTAGVKDVDRDRLEGAPVI
jgi:hypothetical protein